MFRASTAQLSRLASRQSRKSQARAHPSARLLMVGIGIVVVHLALSLGHAFFALVIPIAHPPFDADQSKDSAPQMENYNSIGSEDVKNQLRFPSLFPYKWIGDGTDAQAMAREVTIDLMRQGLVGLGITDLVLMRNASDVARGNLLYTLANLPLFMGVAAQVVHRRRDGGMRVRALANYQLDEAGHPVLLKVERSTEPAQLQFSMLSALFDEKRRARGQSLRIAVIGKEAAAVAMAALEGLYIRCHNDIIFWPRLHRFNEENGHEGLFLVVQTYRMRVEVAEESGFDEGVINNSLSISKVDLAPPAVPNIFPLLFVKHGRSPMGAAKALSRDLSVRSNRIAELIVSDLEARGNAMIVLSSLPPWLNVAAQPAPQSPAGKMRLRVIRDFPIEDRLDAQEFAVFRATDHAQLAGAMAARLLHENNDPKNTMVKLLATGSECMAIALSGIHLLYVSRHREISFKVSPHVCEREGIIFSTEILVVAT